MANGGIIGTVNTPTSTTATGVWQQEEQYEAKVTDTWPQRALFTTNSLRFEDGSSDSLARTPSSSGNRKTWTWSGWIKRSELGRTQNFFSAGTNNSNYGRIQFNSNDTIYIAHVDSASTTTEKSTTQVFRDVSAWYHIVCVMNTTNDVASERMRIYVNGNRETDLGTKTYPAQNTATYFNTATEHGVGNAPPTSSSSVRHFDGYLAEIHFLDGYAYGAEYFGEFDPLQVRPRHQKTGSTCIAPTSGSVRLIPIVLPHYLDYFLNLLGFGLWRAPTPHSVPSTICFLARNI
mgnify:CR=1 FL=1